MSRAATLKKEGRGSITADPILPLFNQSRKYVGLDEDTVDVSTLLTDAGFADPEPDHAWLHDEAFMRIVYDAMPAVYERYRDPDNRAKGEPDLTAKDAIKYLELAAYEAIEVIAEWKKHREGDGDQEAIRHELGDMTLTGMFAAACWDDLCRVYAEQGK